MTVDRDFFISYTAADQAWAEWLAWELNTAGYTTLLQAWDMPPGSAFVHEMDHAAQTTRHTLLVLSPAYLRSPMAEAEWRPGFVADPSGTQRRLLPVRVEECQPAGLLADRVYVDLVGLDEVTTRATLLDGVARAIRGPSPPITPPRFPSPPATLVVDRPRFPTFLPPVWNVSYRRNPDFTGRESEFTALAGALERADTVAVTQILQGGGGVGKTALAVEYAYRQRARFDTVWWVRAEESATLVGDYASLAVALGLVEAGEADQQLAAMAVRRWLDSHDRWLLILDNAEAPDSSTGLRSPVARVIDLLPQVVHGQVLVTSRDARWEQHATLVELKVFTEREAVTFLLARSGRSDEEVAAVLIAELLGWLPLALDQAGAYIRETRIALSAYLDLLRQFPALTLAQGRPRDRDPKATVATTWQVSLERVEPVPGALALLEVCAFLGPEEIPRDLFDQRLDRPATALDWLFEDPFALNEAVAAAHRYGLVKARQHAVVMHRLLQQVIRDSLDQERRHSRIATALRLLRAASPADHANPNSFPTYARLLPHLLAVTGHAEELEVDLETTAWLLTEAGLYLWKRADLQQAAALHKRALSIREARLGKNHPETAESLNYLALVLRGQGDLAGAHALHQRALAIREKRLGKDHPDTATSLSNLAAVLRAQGDLAGAHALHRRALAIREDRLGPDHPDTAYSLNNLALIVRAQGDLAGAHALHRRALAIREDRLGPDHPDTAQSLSNLATVLRAQGDLAGARHLNERALAIRQDRLGPDHPDTAYSLSHLAAVLIAQGDLAGAHALHRRALAIREDRLGPDHPDTAQSLSNLATVLRAQGDLAGARHLNERALAIREDRLGPDHPMTVRSREQLGTVVAELESNR